MSNLVDYAKSELKLAGMFDDSGDFYGGMMGTAVMKMIELFSEENHSGMSASLAVDLFQRLARFEPITPLTGEDDEWSEPLYYEGLRQNKRCSHVFMGPDGRAFDSEGKVFCKPGGDCYTNNNSRVYISFPYTPSTEYVQIESEGTLIDE